MTAPSPPLTAEEGRHRHDWKLLASVVMFSAWTCACGAAMTVHQDGTLNYSPHSRPGHWVSRRKVAK